MQKLPQLPGVGLPQHLVDPFNREHAHNRYLAGTSAQPEKTGAAPKIITIPASVAMTIIRHTDPIYAPPSNKTATINLITEQHTAESAVLININANLPPADSKLTEAWCEYYVTLGRIAIAKLDVKFAQDQVDRAKAESDWWAYWVKSPNNLPNPAVEPPYKYYELLETVKQATVGLFKASELLFAATRAEGYMGDDKSALKLGFELTYGSGKNSEGGPNVALSKLKAIRDGAVQYKQLVKDWTRDNNFRSETQLGLSTTYAIAVVNHAADRLSSVMDFASGYPSSAAILLSQATAALKGANVALDALVSTLDAQRAAVSSQGAKVMPAGWSVSAYLDENEAQRLVDALIVLTSDVIGEGRAATVLCKIAADKAKHSASIAATIGAAMLNTAIGGAGGSGTPGVPDSNSPLTQKLALKKKLAAEFSWYLNEGKTDTEMKESEAKQTLWMSQVAELDAIIVNESVGIDHLTQEVQLLIEMSTAYNQDSKDRMTHIVNRSKDDKIPLEQDTVEKLAVIGAETQATDQTNVETEQKVADAVELTKNTLEAGDLLDDDIGGLIHQKLTIKAGDLPPPSEKYKPKDPAAGSDSNVGMWAVAGAAVIAAMTSGRKG